jgi:hypothetical protein
MRETIETAAELVRALRRQGVRAFCLPGIDMVGLVPGEAVTSALRKIVQSHVEELVTHLRATGLGAEPEDRLVLNDLNAARIVWIDAGSIPRSKSLTRRFFLNGTAGMSAERRFGTLEATPFRRRAQRRAAGELLLATSTPIRSRIRSQICRSSIASPRVSLDHVLPFRCGGGRRWC